MGNRRSVGKYMCQGRGYGGNYDIQYAQKIGSWPTYFGGVPHTTPNPSSIFTFPTKVIDKVRQMFLYLWPCSRVAVYPWDTVRLLSPQRRKLQDALPPYPTSPPLSPLLLYAWLIAAQRPQGHSDGLQKICKCWSTKGGRAAVTVRHVEKGSSNIEINGGTS